MSSNFIVLIFLLAACFQTYTAFITNHNSVFSRISCPSSKELVAPKVASLASFCSEKRFSPSKLLVHDLNSGCASRKSSRHSVLADDFRRFCLRHLRSITNKTDNIFSKIIVLAALFFKSFPVKKALAAASSVSSSSANAAKQLTSVPKGWDLFGRVPYDDYLFTSWRLTNPNLLKRSFVETVSYT